MARMALMLPACAGPRVPPSLADENRCTMASLKQLLNPGFAPRSLNVVLLLPLLVIVLWPFVAMGSTFWLLGAAAPGATAADQWRIWPISLLGYLYPLLFVCNVIGARKAWGRGRHALAWALAAWPWAVLLFMAYLASLFIT